MVTMPVWYALRTFYAQEKRVGDYLSDHEVEYFIPMLYKIGLDVDGKPVRRYYPAIHNLLFICQNQQPKVLKGVIDGCPLPIKVYTQTAYTREWYAISDAEILELRMICDRNFSEPPLITLHEGDIEVGRMVKVVHGPMKGIKGVLVRKNKKYYLLKTVANLDVRIAVSRWCCELDPTNQTKEII